MTRQLWAPWRLEYIEQADEQQGCVFCLAAAGDDEAALVVHRGRHAFVLLNKFPYSSGHLMVAPSRHVAALGRRHELHARARGREGPPGAPRRDAREARRRMACYLSCLDSRPKSPRITSRSMRWPVRDLRKSPTVPAPPPDAFAAFLCSSVGAGFCSSRAASSSRALWESTRVPYFAYRGDAFAAASTSEAAAIFDRGARIFVCTTGVGTPFSFRIVTAASPIPSDVSSSPRS